MNLTTTESDRLRELEAVIQRGKDTFVEVGTALAEIRDAKLYRPAQTFEEYCRERWGFDRTYAHRLIESAAVCEVLPLATNPPPSPKPAPFLSCPPSNSPPRGRRRRTSLSQCNLAQVDIRQQSAESQFVNGSKPYAQDLAQAYGLSRQGLYCVMESNALTRADLLNPDYVFQRLLDIGRISPLRTRLSDPMTRAKITKQISIL